MRRLNLVVLLIGLIVGSYGLSRYHGMRLAAGSGQRSVRYYVDPMHPAYKSDKPGTAPDCGMPLVPVYAEEVATAPLREAQAHLPAGTVTIDGATQRLAGIHVAAVERGGSTRAARVVGRVVPEDTLVYRINSGVEGFIRETVGDSVGVHVKKDQKLATYYAPDFLAVASGFLAAVERVPGAVGHDGSRTVPFPGTVSKQGVSSIQGYTDRLRNLGMSDVQINRMAEIHQIPDSIEVVSPVDGFIVARNISPGQHFEHGMEFYRIADLSRVWVIAQIFEQVASKIHPGDSATVKLTGEGRRMAARVADSLPQSAPGGGTVELRLEVDNPRFVLRPGMWVDVELPVHIPPAVTVPVDAVVVTGDGARVYVERSDGIFEPRNVETGWQDGDRVQILRGVEPGERVVASATFLVDSESRLKASASANDGSATAGEPARLHHHMTTSTVRDPVPAAPHQGHGDD